LSEHGVDKILGDGGKRCMADIIEHRIDIKILFNDVSFFIGSMTNKKAYL